MSITRTGYGPVLGFALLAFGGCDYDNDHTKNQQTHTTVTHENTDGDGLYCNANGECIRKGSPYDCTTVLTPAYPYYAPPPSLRRRTQRSFITINLLHLPLRLPPPSGL